MCNMYVILCNRITYISTIGVCCMLSLVFLIQWPVYFKTIHGTKKMWSYIAGGLKIKGHLTQSCTLDPNPTWSYKQGWS